MMWFMSYTFVDRRDGERRYGCNLGEEHPVLRIARWNRENKDRVFVLIFYSYTTQTGTQLDVEN